MTGTASAPQRPTLKERLDALSADLNAMLIEQYNAGVRAGRTAAEAGCGEDPVGRWKTEVQALSLPDLIASFGPVAEAGDERG